jgi:hypothetical protein
MSTLTTSSKWWWNKKSTSTNTDTNTKKKFSKEKSVASSINGADEGASMFSLYSYDQQSLYYCPSTIHVSSSIRAQHTKSEYSGNFSDVESNASILSKPWISRNILVQEEQEQQHEQPEEIDDDEDDSILSFDDKLENSTDHLDNNKNIRPKRRASLVEYIVQGKLKVLYYKSHVCICTHHNIIIRLVLED